MQVLSKVWNDSLLVTVSRDSVAVQAQMLMQPLVFYFQVTTFRLVCPNLALALVLCSSVPVI